jgi:hypothetical protein
MTVPTPPATARSREPGLAATLALYTAARIGVVAVIAVLLSLTGMPVLLALLIALVVALPLSTVLFRGLRARLDTALAQRGARRREQRDALRAELRGERGAGAGEPSEPERPADGESDAGGDRPGQQ